MNGSQLRVKFHEALLSRPLSAGAAKSVAIHPKSAMELAADTLIVQTRDEPTLNTIGGLEVVYDSSLPVDTLELR